MSDSNMHSHSSPSISHDMSIARTWFDTNPAPSTLDTITSSLSTFLSHHTHTSRIVIITSGGTIVPLEQNMVRFIDNFSTGKRGAASAEHFLSHGYIVIYITRTGCAQPYARHLQNVVSTSYIDLKLLDVCRVNGDTITLDGDISHVINAIKTYHEMLEKHRLHVISFTTIAEYLHILRTTCTLLQPWYAHAILYSAAAVSDFSLSLHEQTTHKIQSQEGPLHLTLPQTPKMLLLARHIWLPHAFMISFKLETDMNILMKKAHGAMDKYGMNVVVANELHTRNDKVIIVLPSSQITVNRPANDELDTELIRILVKLHDEFIQQHQHKRKECNIPEELPQKKIKLDDEKEAITTTTSSS